MNLPAPVLTAFQWSRALKSTGAKAKLIGSKFLHVIQTPTHSLTERTENVRQTTIQTYSFAHLTLMETGTESQNVLRRLLTDEGALAKAAVPPGPRPPARCPARPEGQSWPPDDSLLLPSALSQLLSSEAARSATFAPCIVMRTRCFVNTVLFF